MYVDIGECTAQCQLASPEERDRFATACHGLEGCVQPAFLVAIFSQPQEGGTIARRVECPMLLDRCTEGRAVAGSEQNSARREPSHPPIAIWERMNERQVEVETSGDEWGCIGRPSGAGKRSLDKVGDFGRVCPWRRRAPRWTNPRRCRPEPSAATGFAVERQKLRGIGRYARLAHQRVVGSGQQHASARVGASALLSPDQTPPARRHWQAFVDGSSLVLDPRRQLDERAHPMGVLGGAGFSPSLGLSESFSDAPPSPVGGTSTTPPP